MHVFGAYFGLAVAKMLCVSVDGENTRVTSDSEQNISEKDQSSYNSDLFALLGTLFMWIYWVRGRLLSLSLSLIVLYICILIILILKS